MLSKCLARKSGICQVIFQEVVYSVQFPAKEKKDGRVARPCSYVQEQNAREPTLSQPMGTLTDLPLKPRCYPPITIAIWSLSTASLTQSRSKAPLWMKNVAHDYLSTGGLAEASRRKRVSLP